MDSQLTEPKNFVRQIVGAIITTGILLVLFWGFPYLQQLSSPYLHEVLSLQGDAVKGEKIFQINCSGCHGLQADGVVGPSLRHVSHRRSRLSLIHQVIDGKTPPMPKFQPEPQNMADLLSFLKTL